MLESDTFKAAESVFALLFESVEFFLLAVELGLIGINLSLLVLLFHFLALHLITD
jgi:hypothetical protein